MTVLIDKMNKPEYCLNCPMRGYDRINRRYLCNIVWEECPSRGKLDNCPVREVPESKRLIDADNLLNIFREWEKYEGYSEGERNIIKCVIHEVLKSETFTIIN